MSSTSPTPSHPHPQGLPEKRAIPVTVPQSPAFELKKRKLAAEHEVDIASADSDDGSSEVCWCVYILTYVYVLYGKVMCNITYVCACMYVH